MKKQTIFLAYFLSIHMSSSNWIFMAIHRAEFHQWIGDGIFCQIEQLIHNRDYSMVYQIQKYRKQPSKYIVRNIIHIQLFLSVIYFIKKFHLLKLTLFSIFFFFTSNLYFIQKTILFIKERNLKISY